MCVYRCPPKLPPPLLPREEPPPNPPRLPPLEERLPPPNELLPIEGVERGVKLLVPELLLLFPPKMLERCGCWLPLLKERDWLL